MENIHPLEKYGLHSSITVWRRVYGADIKYKFQKTNSEQHGGDPIAIQESDSTVY